MASRKHYVALAAALKNHDASAALRSEIASVLRSDNSRFNREKFIDASEPEPRDPAPLIVTTDPDGPDHIDLLLDDDDEGILYTVRVGVARDAHKDFYLLIGGMNCDLAGDSPGNYYPTLIQKEENPS